MGDERKEQIRCGPHPLGPDCLVWKRDSRVRRLVLWQLDISDLEGDEPRRCRDIYIPGPWTFVWGKERGASRAASVLSTGVCSPLIYGSSYLLPILNTATAGWA